MSDIAIQVSGLSKQYHIGAAQYRSDSLRDWLRARLRRGRHDARDELIWALKNVSFEVKRGEVVGVIGRNGAGKSTLLRVIAGILRPDRGSIDDQGNRAELLTLQAGFNIHLSGRENILLSGVLMGMPRKAIKAKVDQIVEQAELQDFVDEPVKTYSSGMRTRLGFCTAFAISPDILLIDEVLGVGDAKFAEKSARMIQERIATNRTAVIVSHSEHKLKDLCDRVIWIEAGKTKMTGSPDEVLAAYQANLATLRSNL